MQECFCNHLKRFNNFIYGILLKFYQLSQTGAQILHFPKWFVIDIKFILYSEYNILTYQHLNILTFNQSIFFFNKQK